MTTPLWLIAEREFRTYVVTLSFWAALAVGPLAMGAGLLLAENVHGAPPAMVEVVGSDARLKQAAEVAVREAALSDSRPLRFGSGGTRITISARRQDLLDLDFASGFPLSPAARLLVARTLEREAAQRMVGALIPTVHEITHPDALHQRDPAAVARLLLMAMLWLTLTGSLGMLLQAVVRERASRSLESLLAAAAPWQIMAGKLIGVGCVSLLVLAAWLGSSAALMHFAPGTGLAPAIFTELANPFLLLRAAIIYLFAFAFFGSVTVALGAMARDSASAQNLSRPMFTLLVVAFFVALASVMGAATPPPWLIYVPVFAPFLLLLLPANGAPVVIQILVFILLFLSSMLAAQFAVTRFSLSTAGGRARTLEGA